MKVFFLFFFIFFYFLVFLVVIFFLGFSFYLTFFDSGGPFECGFQGFSGLGCPFSFPFFLVSLMFLLFDVEILLICLYPLVSGVFYYFDFFMWFVVLLVLFATLYEWLKGVLSWV